MDLASAGVGTVGRFSKVLIIANQHVDTEPPLGSKGVDLSA